MAIHSDIVVTFPGGKRVDAQIGERIVHTDQPVDAGGGDSAPTPYELFLASMGTCAGIFVLSFLQSRDLPTEGVRLTERLDVEQGTHLLRGVSLDVHLPKTIPAKYREAIVRTAEKCSVKRAMQAAPAFAVRVVVEPT